MFCEAVNYQPDTLCKSYRKLPIPEPDKVQQVTEALSGLIASRRR